MPDARIYDLAARRQELAERACGVGLLKRVRIVAGRVMVATTLDDEALALYPAEARYLAALLIQKADEAEREDERDG